jgi:ABC-type multidrug transport system ATPase subunit
MIFIDETLSNMDIESVAFFENYILEMQKEKPMTWVIVSHQLSNIKRLCEYAFFMHSGEIKASGPTDALLSAPGCAELKQYLQYI